MQRLSLALCIIGFWSVLYVSLAQEEACVAQIHDAIEFAGGACQELGRNKACYGNQMLRVELVTGDNALAFDTVGDQILVTDIESMIASPLDEARDEWGIALLKVVATGIDNTIPGQLVTVVVFGDTQFAPQNELIDVETVDADLTIQSYIVRTGIGVPTCAKTPTSGLLIQSESQGGNVIFQLNHTQIVIGSTVFAQLGTNGELEIYVLEGLATITTDDVNIEVPAGTFSRVPMSVDLRPAGEPSAPQVFDPLDFQYLPLELLPESFDYRSQETVQTELFAQNGVTVIGRVDEDPDSYVMELSVTRPWIRTPIQLKTGDTVTITASGEALTCNHADCDPPYNQDIGPAGFPDQTCMDCIAIGLPEMLLVGRVGDGAPFAVGRGVTFTAEMDGALYLAANDADYAYDDNEGHFDVVVQVER